MNSQNPQYPVGTLGQPWGEREKQQWLDRQRAQRSYQVDVISQIDALASHFDVESYGELDYTHLNAAAADAARYPVFVLRQTDENPDNPYVLVTGGVHGYETSGVHGALAFARGLVDQIRTEGKIAPFPPGVSAPFRSQASQGV
ncbi:hypothetical protein B0I24_1071, partial [Aliidiomarina maris]